MFGHISGTGCQWQGLRGRWLSGGGLFQAGHTSPRGVCQHQLPPKPWQGSPWGVTGKAGMDSIGGDVQMLRGVRHVYTDTDTCPWLPTGMMRTSLESC